MNDAVRALFARDAELYPVEPSLWSTLAPGGRAERYDAIVDSYDRVIGSRFYQRLAWGNDPGNDTAFAQEAVASASGALLDVGCGSLLFTARAHRAGGRPTLLLDLSLGMLRRGKRRLEELGGVPWDAALVQADALALPLAPACADTILCPGILHLFEQPSRLVEALAACLAPGGRLFLSALVSDRRFGRGYLRLLERSGEVKSALESQALRRLVEQAAGRSTSCDTVGNMAYLRTEMRR